METGFMKLDLLTEKEEKRNLYKKEIKYLYEI